MRAFIAVDLSEELRAKIKGIQKQFVDLEKQGGIKLKFANPWQVHQTVKFLGEIPENSVEEIKIALAETTQKPFDIKLRGVGFFPEASLEKAKNIRVVWIGMEKGEEELKALQKEVESELSALGFPPEKRFGAHVTLCRVKKRLSQAEIWMLLNKIAELKDIEVGTMLVEELKLKRSTLTPKGPIYEDVYVKRLREEG